MKHKIDNLFNLYSKYGESSCLNSVIAVLENCSDIDIAIKLFKKLENEVDEEIKKLETKMAEKLNEK